MFIYTEVLVKSDMRQKNVFNQNKKVSDNLDMVQCSPGILLNFGYFFIFSLQKVHKNGRSSLPIHIKGEHWWRKKMHTNKTLKVIAPCVYSFLIGLSFKRN